MCIIIRRDVAESPQCQRKTNRTQQGFTLPEVLVSLCIVLMLLFGVYQWGIVMQRTAYAMTQNQQAIFLCKQLCAGITPTCQPDWSVAVHAEPISGTLYASDICITHGTRQWQFYYVGPEVLQDGAY